MKRLTILAWMFVLFFYASYQPVYAEGGIWTTTHGIGCRDGFAAWVNGRAIKNDARFDQIFDSLAGPNIWIGYPRGWDIPGYTDDQGHWLGRGAWEADFTLKGCGHTYDVWVWRANGVSDYRYLFVFNSMSYGCGGGHCGNHDFAYDWSWAENHRIPMTFVTGAGGVLEMERL